MHAALLTPAQVARSLGLSESSVRRLCDRGVLEVRVTAGGHRRISVQSVQRYARRDGDALSAHAVLGGAGKGGRLAPAEALLARSVAALRQGDGPALRRVVDDGCAAGADAASLVDRVLAPAMATLGQAWCAGQLSIYAEHRATEQLLAIAAERRALCLVRPRAPRALCAAPSGDPNSLPCALAAWVLAEAGYDAVLIGADTPAHALCEAVSELHPRLVALSVSHVADEGALARECTTLLAATRGVGALLALGGRGIGPALRSVLSADYIGGSLGELRELAKRRRAPRKDGSHGAQ
jgi:MerR family transcriptional regulator, light-induced transcriptional regulator